MYAGIIGDTGRFLYDLATARTHRVVADLMATGIDAPAIGRQEEEISLAEARLISDALQTVTVTAASVPSPSPRRSSRPWTWRPARNNSR
nr:hypothetical protein [Lacticaseibacillus nasuensis]